MGGGAGVLGVLGVARPPGPTKGVEPAGAGLDMGMGMLMPGGITGGPCGAAGCCDSGVDMRMRGLCGITGGAGAGVAVPTTGGGAGCGSGMPITGPMNGWARTRAAADSEGTANR
jgi:hypothetical protein